jgi:hypothetical protein
MNDNPFEIDELIRLIGCDRSDSRFVKFIALDHPPVFTVDGEDGADDEYVEFKGVGVGFYFESNKLTSVFLHSGEDGTDYERYEDSLPMGIFFGQSKNEVAKTLGSPDDQGGGHDEFFGDIPEWFKYHTDACTMHIEFAPASKRIRMVSLMPGYR